MNKLIPLLTLAFVLTCSTSNASIFVKKNHKPTPTPVATSTPTRQRVLVVPAEYKDSKVVVVGSEEYNELLSNKKIAEQLKKDYANLGKEKKSVDEELKKQAEMKDKMVNDLNKLQKELVQKNLAILWRNIIIVSLLVLIAVYFYAKANGLFFL